MEEKEQPKKATLADLEEIENTLDYLDSKIIKAEVTKDAGGTVDEGQLALDRMRSKDLWARRDHIRKELIAQGVSVPEDTPFADKRRDT